jgi:hypothetical protein
VNGRAQKCERNQAAVSMSSRWAPHRLCRRLTIMWFSIHRLAASTRASPNNAGTDGLAASRSRRCRARPRQARQRAERSFVCHRETPVIDCIARVPPPAMSRNNLLHAQSGLRYARRCYFEFHIPNLSHAEADLFGRRQIRRLTSGE